MVFFWVGRGVLSIRRISFMAALLHYNCLAQISFAPAVSTPIGEKEKIRPMSAEHPRVYWPIYTGPPLQNVPAPHAPHKLRHLTHVIHENDLILVDSSVASCKTTGTKRHLEGHTKCTYIVTFSQDGLMLVSGSEDCTIILWDSMTGDIVKTLSSPLHAPVRSLSLTRDAKTLASAIDGKIVLWDILTGNSTITVGSLYVNFVSFSADGRTLASASCTAALIQLWEIHGTLRFDGELVRGHTGSVSALDFSPDGNTLASGGGDQTVVLWDKSKRMVISSLRCGAAVTAVVFSSDGKMLAIGSQSHEVLLWDAQTYSLRQLIGLTGVAISLSFSHDGTTLASAGSDSIILWDVATCAVTCKIPGTEFRSSSFCRDNNQTKTLAVGRSGGEVVLVDVANGKATLTLKGHTKTVHAAAFNSTTTTLASGGADTNILLWNVVTGEVTSTLKYHQEAVLAVAFSGDDKTLVSGGKDTFVVVWDVLTCSPRGKFPVLGVKTLYSLSDGVTMAGGICRQQQTKFWNISPGHECWLRNLQFEATAGAVRSIIFSPKYRTLALLDDIGILRLFREIGKEWTECWSLPHKHQDFLTEACCRSSGCKSCICRL